MLKNSKDWIQRSKDSLLAKSTFTASNGLQMSYRLFSPNNNEKEKLPIVIFLHGRGDRGTDNGTQIYNEAGIIMNSNGLLNEKTQEKYPCYILVPQFSDKTENEEWAKWIGNTPETPFKGLGKGGSYSMNFIPSESGQAASELIQKTIKEFHIDENRAYLIGK